MNEMEKLLQAYLSMKVKSDFNKGLDRGYGFCRGVMMFLITMLVIAGMVVKVTSLLGTI